MKDLIKKILREQDEFGWAEEIIDHTESPYEMNITDLAKFLNGYFSAHSSPNLGRHYRCNLYPTFLEVIDDTGLYTTIEEKSDKPFVEMIDKIKKTVDKYESKDDVHRLVYLEYKDLYDTLRPLIRDNIREQANDMDWFNIDDMLEPKGIALANIIEEYFKDNELPYYITIRKYNNVIYISDLVGDYVVEDTNNFTIDRIISSIEESLIDTEGTSYHKEYLEFYKDIQPLFDKLK